MVLKEELQVEHDKLIGPEASPMVQQTFMMKSLQMGTDSVCPEKLAKLAEKLKQRGAYLCPTLNVLSRIYEMSLKNVKEKQNLDEVPEMMKNMIKRSTDSMGQVSRMFVREFAEHGVKLLVVSGNPLEDIGQAENTFLVLKKGEVIFQQS